MINAFLSDPNAVFGAILLASFVAWLGYRTAHRGRRANACAAFRVAILNELGSIYPNSTAWPENIDVFLRSRFAALQSAVENFRPFLPWWKRSRFDRAWRIYRLGADGRDIDIQHYGQYRPYNIEGLENGREYKQDQTLTCKIIFKKNVDQLLSFADET